MSFRNFITDTDLAPYHPNLQKQLWQGHPSYATQISEAFDRVNNDLFNMNVNPRLIMTPFDLKRQPSITGHIALLSTTETASTTSTSISCCEGFRRFDINVTGITNPWVIQLQGSNSNQLSDFSNVPNASITASSSVETSQVFSLEYAYYRYVSTPLSGGSSITYTASLLETMFDKLIIYKTFSLIFADFVRTQGDQSEILKRDYNDAYNRLIQHIKYSYDVNDDGLLEDAEEISFTETYFER